MDFSFGNVLRHQNHGYNTRNKNNRQLPFCKSNWGKHRSDVLFINEWNNLPEIVNL